MPDVQLVYPLGCPSFGLSLSRRVFCGAPLRVLIHDFSGHPFQAQLARMLAARSHHVIHVSSSSYSTGKGRLAVEETDPPGLGFEDVPVPGGWNKYSYSSRLRAERRYASAFLGRFSSWHPDVVVSSNVPLVAHDRISRGLGRLGVPEVFWHQDVYSAAIGDMVRGRLGALGVPLASLAKALEAAIARRAAAVVAISDAFLPVYKGWSVDPQKVLVQPNWGPLDEVRPAERVNEWAVRHALLGKGPVFLYAGTLGLKHNPDRLVDLARRLQRHGGILVVASEGTGMDYLKGLDLPDGSVRLLGFQPYDELPLMLASADVLVTLLEPEAGRYSVPSKVLTNHCAGRAQLASMPLDNAAARMIRDAGSGLTVAPGDSTGWEAAIDELVASEQQLPAMGRRARAYGEQHFDLTAIADRFEAVLETAASDGESATVAHLRSTP